MKQTFQYVASTAVPPPTPPSDHRHTPAWIEVNVTSNASICDSACACAELEMEEFIFYRFFRNTSLALTAAIVSAKQFGVEWNTLLKFVIYNAMQETRVRIQMSDKK